MRSANAFVHNPPLPQPSVPSSRHSPHAPAGSDQDTAPASFLSTKTRLSLRPAACPIPQRGRTAAGPGGTVAENRIGERRNKEETDGKEKRPGSGPHRPPHGKGNGPPKDSEAPAIGKNGPPHAGPRSRCAGRGFRGAPPRTGEAESSWTRPQYGPPRTARPHAGEPSSARTATTRTTKGSEKRAGERRVAPPRLRRGFPPTPFRGASARRWGRRRRRNPGPRGRHWRRRTP